VMQLPGLVAHNCDHRGAGDVICISEEAACGRLKAEGAEVVSRDELTDDGAGGLLGAIATDNDWAVGEAGLHGGELLKFGCVLLDVVICSGGEVGVVGVVLALRSSADAAVVGIAEADKSVGIDYGEVLEQDGVDQ